MKSETIELKGIAQELTRLTGYKTGYGNDNFKALDVRGPFVHVYVGGLKKDYKKALVARTSVLKILDSYYRRKSSSKDLGARLILRKIGIHGDFLIVNQNADTIDFLARTLKNEAMEKHTAEFKAFGKFLREL